MKKILVFLFSIWVGVFAYSSENSSIQDFQEIRYLYSFETLEGIDKLSVVIEPLSYDAKKIGLTENRLKTVTELRLRKNGIKIDGIGNPDLLVNVHVVGRAFHVSISIIEVVNLIRLENSASSVTIYNQGITGTHGSDSEYIVTGLSQLLD